MKTEQMLLKVLEKNYKSEMINAVTSALLSNLITAEEFEQQTDKYDLIEIEKIDVSINELNDFVKYLENNAPWYDKESQSFDFQFIFCINF